MAPGDLAVLYTDGVTEAENAAKEQFGTERLFQVFADGSPGDARTASNAVLDAVAAFVGGAPQSDDITCLTLSRNKTDSPARLSLRLAMTAEELQRAAAEVEAFAQAQDWPVGLTTHIQLAIEEFGVNVVNYGRDENRAGDPAIDIEVSSSPDAVTVEIADDGRPFNPLEDAPAADTTSPMDERPIAGSASILCGP